MIVTSTGKNRFARNQCASEKKFGGIIYGKQSDEDLFTG